jgi:hypothetical protein
MDIESSAAGTGQETFSLLPDEIAGIFKPAFKLAAARAFEVKDDHGLILSPRHGGQPYIRGRRIASSRSGSSSCLFVSISPGKIQQQAGYSQETGYSSTVYLMVF